MAKGTVKANGLLGNINIPEVKKRTKQSMQMQAENPENNAEVENRKEINNTNTKEETVEPIAEPQKNTENEKIDKQSENFRGAASVNPLTEPYSQKYSIDRSAITKSIFELDDDELLSVMRKREKRDQRKTFLLTPTNAEWVMNAADKYCTSINDIINELIDNEIKREKERQKKKS